MVGVFNCSSKLVFGGIIVYFDLEWIGFRDGISNLFLFNIIDIIIRVFIGEFCLCGRGYVKMSCIVVSFVCNLSIFSVNSIWYMLYCMGVN